MDLASLRIQIDPTSAKRALDEMNGALDKTGSKAKKTTDEAKGFGAGIGSAFSKIKSAVFSVQGAVAGLSFGMVLRNAISEIAPFQEAMSKTLAVTQATGVEMELLRNQARMLGATTRFTATEAAEGMAFLGMAGFNAQKILAAMPDMLNLATAGIMDLGTAADIASNIMTAFHMKAEESGRMADLLATAASATNTNVQQLAEGMKYVGPVAAGLGVEVEKTAAALGVLSNAGIQSSMAGTSLRMILTRLVNPTTEAEKIFKQFGLTLEELDPRVNDLSVIFERMQSKGIGAEHLMKIFDVRGGPAAIELLRQATTDLKKFELAFSDTTGRAEEMARIMQDNIPGAWRAFKSALGEMFHLLGDAGLAAIIRGVLDVGAAILRLPGTVKEAYNEMLGYSTASLEEEQKNLELTSAKIGKLVETFDKLQGKPKLAAEEQELLFKAVEALHKVMPDFTFQFDEYGNVILDATGNIKGLREEQERLQEAMVKNEIDTRVKSYQQLEIQIAKIEESIGSYREIIADLEKEAYGKRTIFNMPSSADIQSAIRNIESAKRTINDLLLKRAEYQQQLEKMSADVTAPKTPVVPPPSEEELPTEQIDKWAETIDKLVKKQSMAAQELVIVRGVTGDYEEGLRAAEAELAVYMAATEAGITVEDERYAGLKALVEMTHQFMSETEKLKEEISTSVELTEKYLDPQEKMNQSLAVLQGLLDKNRISIETYNAAVADLTGETKRLADLKEYATGIEKKYGDQQIVAADEMKRLKEAQDAGLISALAYANAIDDVTGALEKRNEVMAEGMRWNEAFMTAEEKAADDLRTLETLWAANAISADTYSRALEQLNEQMEAAQLKTALEAGNWRAGIVTAAKEYIDEFGNVAKGIQAAFDSTLRGIEDALVEFFTTGKTDLGAFISQIHAEITRLAVIRPLMAQGMEWLGLGAMGTLPFAMGGIVPHGLIPIQGYAGGGIVRAPQIAALAERGQAEAVVPLPNGRAIEAKVTNMPASSMAITINVQGVQDARSFRENEKQIVRSIERQMRRVHAGA